MVARARRRPLPEEVAARLDEAVEPPLVQQRRRGEVAVRQRLEAVAAAGERTTIRRPSRNRRAVSVCRRHSFRRTPYSLREP